MSKLTPSQIEKALQNLPDWKLENEKLRKTYEFEDFVAAMGFVIEVAQLAEEVGHHPDIDIRYNKVILALTTRDEGGVTERDVRLAREIEEM
ncbi:MAG: 4a-hydroxytetrahydrobiopterin dehydratase [Armatimonadetes bacterium]|nr:4a-hydroxytetrahydrobiopterin dehydratase [Armatimonadota bacterium]